MIAGASKYVENFLSKTVVIVIFMYKCSILDKASLRTLFESDSQESGCDFVLAEDTEAVPAKVNHFVVCCGFLVSIQFCAKVHMLGIPVVSVEWLFDSIKSEKLMPC